MPSNRRRAASSLQEARSSGSYRHRNSSSSPLAPRPASRLCLAATAPIPKRSSCTSWGTADKDFYLLHVLRRRMEYPELKHAVCQQADAFNANVVLIEDKASGTQLIQELVEQGLHAVTRYQPQSDKVMCMHAQTAVPGLDPGIENVFLHLPKEAGWRAEYLHELTVFPGGKHDDQVDSTAQLLDWLKQAGREPGGIYQYYKKLAGEPQTARPEPLSTMAKRLGLLLW